MVLEPWHLDLHPPEWWDIEEFEEFDKPHGARGSSQTHCPNSPSGVVGHVLSWNQAIQKWYCPNCGLRFRGPLPFPPVGNQPPDA